MTQQILILEDMPDTQNWLHDASLLAFPDASIFVAENIAKASSLTDEIKPSLALIDLELPDGKGHEFIVSLLAKHPLCLCIIVTIYADEDHLFPSLKNGARGYILKDQSRQRIADMLQQAMAGELPLSPTVASMVLTQLSTPDRPVPDSPLTRRESEVLGLIASGATTADVANQLSISKYTVEDHLKNIYRKLEISSRAEAALVARKLNLI